MSELPGRPIPAAVQPDAGAVLPARTIGGRTMEIWISYVLRIGVLTAGGIILLGLALYLIEGADAGGPSALDDLLGDGGHPIATSWRSIGRGIGHAKPLAIIQLGLLVLILTPLSRVAMTMILFLLERDWIFVAITVTVLVVLVIGFIGIGS